MYVFNHSAIMQVHAVVLMAATKLLGRLPAQHTDALKAIVSGCTRAHNVEVQQRSCEVSQVLKLKTTLPVRPTDPCVSPTSP
jgi:ribulose-5-phosphate 4-epimerase/fuculose-1-phosphate aldolase